MAYRSSLLAGNMDGAAVWGCISNTPTLSATNVALSSTLRYTAAFTSPLATTKAVGVYIYIANKTAVGTTNLIVQLQSNPSSWGDVAGAYGSIPISSLLDTSTGYWFYVPIVNTTLSNTTAGYYRYKIYSDNAMSNTVSLAADSGTTLYAFLSADDRTGAISTTDDLWISHKITIVGADTAGSKLAVEIATAAGRTINNAINIVGNGELAFDASATSSLTYYGNIYAYSGSKFTQDASGDYSKLQSLIAKMDTAGDSGFVFQDQTTILIKGFAKNYWRTHLSNGVGTVANPLIVSDPVDWTVGDYIVIGAASNSVSNYQETEFRYIKTKNSSTSYVLSNTVGGAEAALTYTHSSDCWIANLSSNCVIDGFTDNKGWWGLNYNNTAGACSITWTRFNNCGTTSSGKYGMYVTVLAGNRCTFNNNISVDSTGLYPFYFTVSKTIETYSNNIMTTPSRTVTNYIGFSGVANKTFNDFMMFRAYRGMFFIGSCYNCVMNRFVAISANAGSSSATYAGFYFGGTGQNTKMNDCEVHCSRYGVYIATPTGVSMNRLLVGTKGICSVSDVLCGLDMLCSITFNSSTFTATTLIVQYLSMLDGSEIRFDTFNTTTGNNFWYTNYGKISSAGAGLTDTTVHTVGGFSVRFAGEVADSPLTWLFDVPTGDIIGKSMSIAVWCKIFSDSYYEGNTYVSPRLTVDYDNGSISYADAALTTEWQLLALTFTAVTHFGQITISLSSQTSASGSNTYVYFGDWIIFYPAGYALNLGNMANWANAKPVTPPISTMFSAKDIWVAATADDYGAGTVMEMMKIMSADISDAVALAAAKLV